MIRSPQLPASTRSAGESRRLARAALLGSRSGLIESTRPGGCQGSSPGLPALFAPPGRS